MGRGSRRPRRCRCRGRQLGVSTNQKMYRALTVDVRGFCQNHDCRKRGSSCRLRSWMRWIDIELAVEELRIGEAEAGAGLVDGEVLGGDRPLIEQVQHVQRELDALIARQPELVSDVHVRLAQDARPSVRQIAAIEDRVGLPERARDRCAAGDVLVPPEREPAELVDGLRLELVRPIGREVAVERFGAAIARVVRAEHVVGLVIGPGPVGAEPAVALRVELVGRDETGVVAEQAAPGVADVGRPAVGESLGKPGLDGVVVATRLRQVRDGRSRRKSALIS